MASTYSHSALSINDRLPRSYFRYSSRLTPSHTDGYGDPHIGSRRGTRMIRPTASRTATTTHADRPRRPDGGTVTCGVTGVIRVIAVTAPTALNAARGNLRSGRFASTTTNGAPTTMIRPATDTHPRPRAAAREYTAPRFGSTRLHRGVHASNTAAARRRRPDRLHGRQRLPAWWLRHQAIPGQAARVGQVLPRIAQRRHRASARTDGNVSAATWRWTQ